MTDSSGAVLSTQKYWPYGAVRSGSVSQTDKLYTGQQEEPGDSALGLYNYKARFYSTTLGRFVSADSSSGGGLDRYRYANNSPLAFTDPSGLTPACNGCLPKHTTRCISGPSPCSLVEPAIELADIAYYSDIVRWWSAYFGVDPAAVMAVIAKEMSEQSAFQALYNSGAYAALAGGGETGLNAFVAAANGVGRLFGLHDEEPDWGPANITLTRARSVLGLIPEGLRPDAGDALGIVNQLNNMGTAIMWAAAVMKNAGDIVDSLAPGMFQGNARTEQQIMLYGMDTREYAKWFRDGAYVGPVRGVDGQYRQQAEGIGHDATNFINKTLPLVDQARATLDWCAGSDAC